MSLNQLATHLAAHGRNGDTTLVHMTQKEVEDLQRLAEKHGTSLTINPHTGLPEASLLGSIFHEVKNAVHAVADPIADLGSQGGGIGNLLIGAALASMGVPPQLAGLIMGGTTAYSTGSLSKGLASGLGAYGGANIYGSVAGPAGVGGSEMTAQSAATMQGQQQAAANAANAATASNTANAASDFALENQSAAETARLAAANTAAAPTSEIAQASYDVLKDNPSALYDKVGLKGAAMAAAPLILSTMPKTAMPTDNTPTTNPADESSYIRPYYYDPVTHSAVALAPVATKDWKSATLEGTTPYTPVQAATGGLLALAEGGAVPGYAYGGQPDADTAADIANAMNAARGIAAAQPQPVTITPNLPNAPAGGFTSMDALRNAYTAGGGSAPAPIQPKQDYTNSGMTQKVYDYLEGNAAYPVQATGIGKNTRYYWGQPPASQQTQAQFENKTWLNPTTGTVENNPYYALDKTLMPTGDPGAGMKWSWDATQLRYLPVKKADGGLLALAAGGNAVLNPLQSTVTQDVQKSFDTLNNQGLGTSKRGKQLKQELDYRSRMQGYQQAPQVQQSNLGGYSDGGRLLKGPGDGVSDSIPAEIAGKQPARLADGEFVVPARIVSELGNGSTDAGARQLYKMMDRVQKARGKTTGKNRVAQDTNAAKYLPA